jgi:hypothetical protein
MSCDIEAVSPDGPLHRLGRKPDPWAWPDWAYAGPEGSFDNRYDDPAGEYRVLYASSERLGAFVETLSRFREDAELEAELGSIAVEAGEGDDVVGPREVPREWLDGRALGTASVAGEFAAVGRSRSLQHLRSALAAVAQELGIRELDGAAIRLKVPRAFTQAVSRHVFECQADDGSSQFAGIHYLSRLGDDIHNWAIFEPAGGAPPLIEAPDHAPVERDDPDFAAALDHLGLELV